MKITGWHTHGETAHQRLIAGFLPPKDIHCLTGTDAAINSAIVADLAVAIAASAVACGLGLPDATPRARRRRASSAIA